MLFSTFTSLRRSLPGSRPFHLLLTSLAVSSCGDWLYNVALLAIVYERTHSAAWLSVTTAARVVPIVALGPLGGALAGRHNRRRLMIASDLSRAGLMLVLAATVTAGLPIALVPVLAGLAAGAGVLTPPCVAASTPKLVADSELQRAQGARSAVGSAAIVVGPALGGLLLIVCSPAVAILANGATFIASAAVIGAIPAGEAFHGSRDSNEPAPSLLADVVAGARALRAAPAAVRLIAADVVCSGVYGVLTVTLVLVGRRLGDGGSGYGILLAGLGAGSVVGAILSGRATEPCTWRRTLTLALVLVGVTIPALGVSPSIFSAVAFALVCGGGMIVGEVLSETALPRMLTEAQLGPAYGLALPISLGGIVLGSLIGGPLVAQFGVQGAMIAVGAFVLLAAALLLRGPLDRSAAAGLTPVHSLETADASA
jgi:MFS family permease